MFIKKLQLKNFKRFSDLTIDLEPHGEEAPKLVLLIGANGSGKSCVFDAFECINNAAKQEKIVDAYYVNKSTKEYFLKDPSIHHFAIRYQFDDNQTVFAQVTSGKIFKVSGFDSPIEEINNLTGNDLQFKEKGYVDIKDFKFYGRSSFRYTSRITKTTIGATRADISQDVDRPKTYIDLDNSRMDADIDQIFRDFFKEIKEKNNAQEKFNTALNNAFSNIFGNAETSLKYEDFDSPLDGEPVRFWFKKGSSRINYDYLSAGEKMVFDLLLNLYARRNFFQDAVYFFDEIDLHLNTSLQKSFLKEITKNWIPEGCQIWTASHSLGFIEYAKEYERGAIIDFDNLDFDIKQTLEPANKNDLSIFTTPIPISSIESLVQLPSIVLCEGKDSKYYQSEEPGKKFFGVKDKFNVLEWCHSFKAYGIIDGDYLLESEKADLENKFEGRLKVLKYYSVESYLFHPDNLFGENESSEKEKYIKEVLAYKEDFLIDKKTSDYFSQIRCNYKILKSRKDGKHDNSWLVEMEDSSNVLQALQLKQVDQFETFYKFLPMPKIKDTWKFPSINLGKNSKEEFYFQLSQTDWFRSQIKDLLK